jgi:Rad3-related DNA helicase
MVNTNEFNELIDDFNIKFCNNEFVFRKYQKETILFALETFFNGSNKALAIEAPTGFGKSMLAIIFAYVANQLGKKGYILASDLSLQSQYENDFERLKIGIHSIRGVDNYLCTENGEKYSLGDCTIRNVPSFQRKSMSCYKDCPYLSARDRAMMSDTSLLNYSYWLIQRNYVAKNMAEEPFTKRDFIVCDETHKVVDIVQNHFSPRIDIMTNQQLERLRQFILSKEFGTVRTRPAELTRTINALFREEKSEVLVQYLYEFENQLLSFLEKGDNIKEFIGKKYANREIPKDWKYGMKLIDDLKDWHCKFEDYNNIIKNTGLKSLIKNPSEESVTFNCLDESYLMQKHFHEESGFELMMSATLGDPKNFVKSIKVENSKVIRIKSTFDFEKSPIFAFTGKKMSFADKSDSFPWIIEKVKEIANIHEKDAGIVHTGSYAFSRDLYSALPTELRKRILFYTNTAEKKDCLNEFYNTENKILIGPSLITGIDLYNDRSRFQIFMKVPYASLADKFVAAKMADSNEWYSEKCIIEILQGIGRSIRHENDWAKTYILDGCFSNLYSRSQNSFPQEFKNRLIWVRYDIKDWKNIKPLNIKFQI